jgi:hypothetical protein
MFCGAFMRLNYTGHSAYNNVSVYLYHMEVVYVCFIWYSSSLESILYLEMNNIMLHLPYV